MKTRVKLFDMCRLAQVFYSVFVCLAMHAIFLFASLVLGIVTREEDGIEGGPADKRTVDEMIKEECWGKRGTFRSKCVDRVRVFKTSRCGIVKR